MRKILPVFLALGLILGLGASQSLAYTQTFLDNTLVQASGTGSGYVGGNWYDIIGNNVYELYQIDVTWNNSDVIVQIYTNTSGNRLLGNYVADVALDLDQNGVWETGIVLKNDNRPSYSTSTMYSFSNSNNYHWLISDNLTGGVYGTNYDTSNNPNQSGSHTPADPPVLLKTTVTPLSEQSVDVSWTPSGSLSDYLLTLTFTGVNGAGDWNAFDFLWATQSCANETQYSQVGSHVPLPGSLLLLGTGLLGLGLLGRRSRHS